jgi:hypothetical protein
LAREGVAGRCAVVAGDFFETALPEGGDVYVLKSVLHDWDDARSIAILKNCREAMGPDSRLLVVERVVPGGLERTEAEYRRIFEAAGFELARSIPTHAPVSIIEGVPRARRA